MVTVNDYAALSADVYNGSGAPTGWTLLPTPSNLPPINDPSFYAAAYQNTATGEVVISYRGSNDWGDWTGGNLS